MSTRLPSLPAPPDYAKAVSDRLSRTIREVIAEQGGWIPFADFMDRVLYTPDLGYYSGGTKKFGAGGDFVTAPEMSSLFGETLARQVAQVLQHVPEGSVLELGAGRGRLAAQLLLALHELGQLPKQYAILEVSAYLREEQKTFLLSQLPPECASKLVWLDTLPDAWHGVILGNEVLDAIPVHSVKNEASGLYERGVGVDNQTQNFVWVERPLDNPALQRLVQALDLPEGYVTEFCPASIALTRALGERLVHGLLLWIDYGFSAREYYHPQRNQGTLMCHYQHYAHSDPFLNVGLQDVTAHVDFTAIAHAGVEVGLQLEGFTTQAQFLINCGITALLSRYSPEDSAQYLPIVSQVQRLLSPAEMGDLFKVIAMTRGVSTPLCGFVSGDRRHVL